ncbi:hypothetical protein B4135_3868 [Caldibacillus debilis]|uniref:Uncharacterized protein n=1 Tax=Caldibacillus debilis TaxID=301148 RepID=A0A150L9H2_9BACI|nr:hypothetical protein B4135_3868 [Caldibacillus debilis]
MALRLRLRFRRRRFFRFPRRRSDGKINLQENNYVNLMP